MTVFALMDEWIVAAGRTDPWLALGLDLLDGWQRPPDLGDGQAHLRSVLDGLHALRPSRPESPDPLALAVWFHHGSAEAAYEAVSRLADAGVALEVARLVTVVSRQYADRGDLAGGLLCAAHRGANSDTRLAPVPPVEDDQ